ncbi:MAG TPA: DUSAM domain-containing protein [Myxococcaceae bacterium]|jgi:DUSAM domain-containing protein
MDPLDVDWYQVRMLDNRVQQGQALELTVQVRELLRRTARTVAISDAEAAKALADVTSATALLQSIRHRVDSGTQRIMRALDTMYRLRKKGDIQGARQQMQEVLAVEVVPHFREIAEGQLEELDSLP